MTKKMEILLKEQHFCSQEAPRSLLYKMPEFTNERNGITGNHFVLNSLKRADSFPLAKVLLKTFF